ncbi:uncharacterized protein NEMAJ01_1631 [Nematocida major]|uniref:uncharacterized protein n=1 Tax=Nematocida major TaxID=1912982 RepID=UPI002008B8E8|nr:uncharacterized protein NEMAJ01_1631 [Nematocida major]KAH9386735.1 hypothetical protein NEMAJ01_1631 [Nematocida major]
MMQKEEMIIKEEVAEPILLLSEENKPEEKEANSTDEAPLANEEQKDEAPAEISAESLENIKYVESGTFEVNLIKEDDCEAAHADIDEEYEDACYTIHDDCVESEHVQTVEKAEPEVNRIEAQSSSVSVVSLRKDPIYVTSEYMEGLSLVQKNIIKMEMEISRQESAAKQQWVPKREILKEDFMYVPVKGGLWVKSEGAQQPRKKVSFFRKLFACMNPLHKGA